MILYYLEPLYKNESKISDTQSFSQELSTLLHFEEDKEDVL